MDQLTRSIETVDLPGLVARLWPESGARPGRAGLCRAVWRGDRHPSLSLFRARGMWFWKDHATGESGNAFGLLLRAGFSKGEAARLIKEAAEDSVHLAEAPPVPAPSPARGGMGYPWRGLTPAERRALEAAQARLDEAALRGRGIPLEGARRVGLGKSRQGDLIIPILGPDGEPQAIKARLAKPQEYRYRYLTPGRGAPAWHSPGFGERPGRAVLVVEGELNAIAVWLALEGRADDPLAGRAGPVHRAEDSLSGRRTAVHQVDDPLQDGASSVHQADVVGMPGVRNC